MVVYHWTKVGNDFNVFDTKQYPYGWNAEDIEEVKAEHGGAYPDGWYTGAFFSAHDRSNGEDGRRIAAYINIENPIVVDYIFEKYKDKLIRPAMVKVNK